MALKAATARRQLTDKDINVGTKVVFRFRHVEWFGVVVECLSQKTPTGLPLYKVQRIDHQLVADMIVTHVVPNKHIICSAKLLFK